MVQNGNEDDDEGDDEGDDDDDDGGDDDEDDDVGDDDAGAADYNDASGKERKEMEEIKIKLETILVV